MFIINYSDYDNNVILIVAECNVNIIKNSLFTSISVILIVAECNVNSVVKIDVFNTVKF